MRVQREDEAFPPFQGAGFDLADHRVAVFDRKRELAAHVRRAHAVILLGRNPA
jgi:hypothetical protein